MPNKLYEINFGEAGSPLRLYDANGGVVFDANYATLCVLGTFAVTLPNNTLFPPPYSATDGTTAFQRSYFPRTLPRPPYHSPLWYNTATGNWVAPTTSYTKVTESSHPAGRFATAFTDSIVFGNFDTSRGFKMSAIVFENGVNG
jgi:hypothetical protein